MGKELVVSSDRHETKVAVLEDGQLVEVYFQRSNEYSLAGSIHKGRVTRVLPGMQSAFVDVGLERDTFLYVSDFFEDESDDFDRISEDRRPRQQPPRAEVAAAPETAMSEAPAVEGEPTAPVAARESAPPQREGWREDRQQGDRRGGRRRRRRGEGGRFPDSKFAVGGGEPRPAEEPPVAPQRDPLEAPGGG